MYVMFISQAITPNMPSTIWLKLQSRILLYY